MGTCDLRTLWSRLVSHPCPENHVPKKFQVLDHVKPPVWNPGTKIDIPHPENHILKVFRFRSWKPRVWKSRPQSWDPKSWKSCPENHILKFPRFFWVLETRSANSRSPKTEDPTSWKSCPKKFQVWVLETHTVYIPKLKSHAWKSVLKNSMSRFWWTPLVQANSRWPKTKTFKKALFSVFKWIISGGLQNRFRQTNKHRHTLWPVLQQNTYVTERRVTDRRTRLSELIYKIILTMVQIICDY